MRTVKIIVASFAVFAAIGVLAFEYLLPIVIEHQVRNRLGSTARFEVGAVALDRVELLDVSLTRGLELGDVTIEAGPWQLFRGKRADVVLSGSRIDTRAITLPTLPETSGANPPFGRVTIVDGMVDELAVAGTIDLRGSVDLTAKSPAMHVGGRVVNDVAATVRGPVRELRACATGNLDGVQLDACAEFDARAREHADLVWAATHDAWSAKGTARLVRTPDSLAIEGGRVDAVLAARTVRGVAIHDATLHAKIAGDLDRITAYGELAVREITSEQLAVRGAALPFAFTGSFEEGVKLRSERELVLTATSATLTTGGRSVRIAAPVITGRGSYAVGKTTLAVVTDDPLRLVAKLRGVSVDGVLAAASRDRVRGTGVLDGELVFDETLALVGGALTARSPGRLHVGALAQEQAQTDAAFAVHRRIAAALADFDYSQLALKVVGDPELRLSLRGRGRRVPQALAIDVNVRGLLAQHERTR